MAVRIQNGATVNFGAFGAQTTVTHARVQVGGSTLTIRPLDNQRTIVANGQAEFPAGDIDLVIPANELENPGLNALLALALNGANAMAVDLMVNANDVVTVGGYSQQSVTNWTLNNEAD